MASELPLPSYSSKRVRTLPKPLASASSPIILVSALLFAFFPSLLVRDLGISPATASPQSCRMPMSSSFSVSSLPSASMATTASMEATSKECSATVSATEGGIPLWSQPVLGMFFRIPTLSVSTLGSIRLLPLPPHLLEDFLRPRNLNIPLAGEDLCHPVYHFPLGPCHHGDIPSLEFHVAPLYPLGGESPERGKVLGQPHRRRHLRQLRGGLDTQNLEADLCHRVGPS